MALHPQNWSRRAGVGRIGSRPLGPERQRQILELLRTRGSVRIGELSARFGVTDETIRRDLHHLQAIGALQRSHGGAVGVTARSESTFSRRLSEHQNEKAAIARAAAALVQDGSTIILDSGTTTAYFARALRGKRDLVVVTNAVTNAFELMQYSDATVVLTGGVVRPTTLGAVGDIAIATIHELRVDQTFLAIQSVSIDGGLTYPSLDEAAVKKAMIAAGSEVILLADSSKFGRESLVRVAPLDVLARVVTTPGMPPEIAQQLADLDIEVIVVEVTEDDAEAAFEPRLHLT